MDRFYWKINDGRIWGFVEARWLGSSEVPEGETAQELFNSGQPGDVEYLKETISFYGGALGELAGPEERRAGILAELDAIDRQSVRPLRAIARGAGAIGDMERVVVLEVRAEELRAELAGLAE